MRTQYIRKTKVVLSDLDLIQALMCVSFRSYVSDLDLIQALSYVSDIDLIQALMCVSFRSYVSDLDLIQALMCVSFRICVSGSLVDIRIYIHRG